MPLSYGCFVIRASGVSWASPYLGLREGSPHDHRERPWKPADADVLIWTSCVKGGGIDGNCSQAAANTKGAARGEAGAAAGGGEAGLAEKASEHSHLAQCRALFPGSEGMGWGSPLYHCPEPEDSTEAQAKEKQVHGPEGFETSAFERMRLFLHPPALIHCKMWDQALSSLTSNPGQGLQQY